MPLHLGLGLLLTKGGNVIPKPAAPSALTATRFSSTRIDLAWSDDSTNETGFEVYRSADNVTFTLLDTTAADAEAYSDTTCEALTIYYYKVRAVGAGGYSAYTDVAVLSTAETYSDAFDSLNVRWVPETGTVGVATGALKALTSADHLGNLTINPEFTTDATGWEHYGAMTRVDSSSDPGDDSTGHGAADKWVGKQVEGSSEWSVQMTGGSQPPCLAGAMYLARARVYTPSSNTQVAAGKISCGGVGAGHANDDVWEILTTDTAQRNYAYLDVRLLEYFGTVGDLIYIDKFEAYRQNTIVLLDDWEYENSTLVYDILNPATSTVPFGAIVRYTDASNYWQVRQVPNTAGDDTFLESVVAGVVQAIHASADVDWTASQIDQMKVEVNEAIITVSHKKYGTSVWTTVIQHTMSTDLAATGTGIMFYDTGVNRLAGFRAIEAGETAPALTPIYVDGTITNATTATYNVTTRSDATGDKTCYKTVDGALAVVGVGGTVSIRAGTYKEKKTEWNCYALPAKNFTLKAYNNEEVILTYPDGDPPISPRYTGGVYDNMIAVNYSDGVIDGITVLGTRDEAIIEDNGGLDHNNGIAFIGAVGDFVVKNCTFTKCGFNGIAYEFVSGPLVIENNKFIDIGTSSRCHGIYASSAAGNTGYSYIRHNTFTGIAGYGIHLYYWPMLQRVYGNVIHHCLAGICCGGESNEIYNNTVCDNTMFGLAMWENVATATLTVKNNIFLNNPDGDIWVNNFRATVTAAHNNFHTYTHAGVFVGTWDSTTDMDVDPEFVDATPETWDDYVLGALSPMIGDGEVLAAPYNVVLDPTVTTWPTNKTATGAIIGAFNGT